MFPHPHEKKYARLSWCDFAWPEIKEAAQQKALVILPLGSVEQHGPMIPVGCDLFLASHWPLEAARRAREKYNLRVLVLPPLPYGIAMHHRDFPGTVSLEPDLYMKSIAVILRDVIRAGFKRIVLVSGHGGNYLPAKVALKDLGSRLHDEGVRDVKLYFADSGNCFTDAQTVYAKLKQGQFNFHADAVETSFYQLMRPDLVRPEGMVKPTLKRQGMPLNENWRTTDITESGASGNPTVANPEYAKEDLDYFCDALADFLKRVNEDD